MDRRTLLGAVGSGVAVSAAGCLESETDAVNVEEADDLQDASDVDFRRDVSVSWIDDRFIEDDTSMNPVIGTDVTFTAMVLTNLQSEEERLQIANRLQWTNFELGGGKIMGPLFEPVSWVLESVKNLTEKFYEKFKVMKVVGVTDRDQEFFDKYGMVPFVWTFSEEDEHYYPSGTIVELTGTVKYADPEEDHFAPGMGKERFYVEVSGSQPVESVRSLTKERDVGAEVTYTGLQTVDQNRLTSYLTDVDYEYSHEFPRPAGGSLVTHTGTLLEADFDVEQLVRDNSARMETTSQNIVVGDTAPGDVDAGPTPTTTEDSVGTGDARMNVVAVIDVSGSMSETDTKSGRTRLEVAKESAKALVNFVESGNRLGVVAFSTSVEVVSSLTAVSNQTREEFITDIDSLSSRRDTSIGGGLATALDELRNAEGPKSIVLLSDGKENEPPPVSEVLPDLKSFGVSVYTIGMGTAVERNLLEELARKTGGESQFAPDPEQIRSFYQQFSISAQERSPLTEEKAELEEGESAELSATVDSSCDDVQFSLSYPGSKITLEVERPNGEVLTESGDVSNRVGETSEVWTVPEPRAGEWTVTARGEQLNRPETASIRVSSDSAVSTELYLSRDLYEETGMIRVEMKATEGRRRYTDADVHLRARTGENEEEIQLRDDGGGPDPVADDGIYTGYFHPSTSGEYEFTVEISGGGVDELERTFRRELDVGRTVDEPTKPYRERSSGGIMGDARSLVAPAGLLAGGVAVLWSMLRMLSETER